jgi:hypothetical protein
VLLFSTLRRRTLRRLTLLSALLLSTSCAVVPPTVSLRMKGNVPDASVTIDDELVGTLALVQKRGVALPHGPHRITVEKPGFFPVDRLVEARPGQEPIHLEVALEPVPE